jgi:hypothetical protein
MTTSNHCLISFCATWVPCTGDKPHGLSFHFTCCHAGADGGRLLISSNKCEEPADRQQTPWVVQQVGPQKNHV